MGEVNLEGSAMCRSARSVLLPQYDKSERFSESDLMRIRIVLTFAGIGAMRAATTAVVRVVMTSLLLASFYVHEERLIVAIREICGGF